MKKRTTTENTSFEYYGRTPLLVIKDISFFIFNIPTLFIISIYQLYVTYMIVENTDFLELSEIENEYDLNVKIKKYSDTFYYNNKIYLNCINLAFWFIFLNIII